MTQQAQIVEERLPTPEPATTPSKDQAPHPIQKALEVIAADAFEAPEKYLVETRVPEGGE